MDKSGIEIERKFIIQKPDISSLRALPSFTESRITQIYLPARGGVTLRVRRREFADRIEYTRTEKRRVDAMSAEELEREITASEYETLAAGIDPATSPLSKTRYAFEHGGRVFEIDEYPAWQTTCIMEVELQSRDTRVAIPDFIRLLREVTGDKTYSNASMSRHFPAELV